MDWKLFFIFFIATVVVGAALAFLYLGIYGYLVNRRLRAHTEKPMQLPAPRAILAVIVALGIIACFCGFTYRQNEDKVPTAIAVHSYFGRIINENQQQMSELAAYGTGENEGYTLSSVQKSGDYTATLYLTDGLMTPEHPYYLFFIENPLLDTDNLIYNYQLSAAYRNTTTGREEVSGVRMFGQETLVYDASNRLLCYGDATDDATFTLTVYFFDRDAYALAAPATFYEATLNPSLLVDSITFTYTVPGWHF